MGVLSTCPVHPFSRTDHIRWSLDFLQTSCTYTHTYLPVQAWFSMQSEWLIVAELKFAQVARTSACYFGTTFLAIPSRCWFDLGYTLALLLFCSASKEQQLSKTHCVDTVLHHLSKRQWRKQPGKYNSAHAGGRKTLRAAWFSHVQPNRTWTPNLYGCCNCPMLKPYSGFNLWIGGSNSILHVGNVV